jgi:hypothetical protein
MNAVILKAPSGRGTENVSPWIVGGVGRSGAGQHNACFSGNVLTEDVSSTSPEVQLD